MYSAAALLFAHGTTGYGDDVKAEFDVAASRARLCLSYCVCKWNLLLGLPQVLLWWLPHSSVQQHKDMLVGWVDEPQAIV
jgi:hypothetical protein